MDRSSYRVSMLLETLVLSSLVASLPLTQRYSPTLGWAGFAVWVWAIYFTFPGTYSTQPAVTTQVGGANEPSRRFYSTQRKADRLSSLRQLLSFTSVSVSMFKRSFKRAFKHGN